MKWSFKLGRFLGIDVYIHLTFLVLLAFIGASHWMAGQNLADALGGMVFFILLFGCVLLHEYGHALMARKFGIGTRDIILLPFGGVASLERMPDKPSQELWVALAGPAVNVVIALGLALWLTLTGTWEPLSQIGPVHGNLAERLLAVNLGLVAFNMLPAFPMDGGRVLRALLAMKLDHARATRIAATIGKGMAAVFGIAGLFGNPMLLVIAFFVWMGASQEANASSMKSAFHGVTVREAMVTDFASVSSHSTLGDVSRLILATSQQDFPVINHDGRAIGMLTSEDVFAAIREHDPDTLVVDVMRTSFDAFEEGELLDVALTDARTEGTFPIAVLHKGRLTGILTAENIHELHLLRSAGALNPGYTNLSLRFALKPHLKHA
ncbi:MAG: site-2 protease family protein [Verrucomicrobiaceae bacterium]|nr:site-2 protease family protein [Verrucomicrobiaceae bacterium]